MRKVSLFIPIFMALSLHLWAQLPDWINPQLRAAKYPESNYLSAFVSEINDKNEAVESILQRLEGYAKDQLADNIMIDIRSVTTLNIHNLNTQTQENFKRSSTAVSGARLAGLKTERYYDEKKKVPYVFVYAAKSDVIKLYEQEIDQHINAVRQLLKQVVQANKESALKHGFEADHLLKKIEEAQGMLVAVAGRFSEEQIRRTEVNELELAVREQIASLTTANDLGLEEAAYFMAYSLGTQTGKLPSAVKIHGVTYQDTPMSSPFSRRFINSLNQKLVTDAQYQLADPAARGNFYTLFGTYWEESNQLKLSMFLRDEVSGETVAAGSCKISMQKLNEAGLSFKPENYQQAMQNMQLFAQNELKGGELRVDVLTNKGKGNQIYVQGESLRLFVRANRECYLRFIYHLADGSQVLLLDNYYLNRDLVNQVYELPYEFECDEPFGVETLQLNAQTEPFEDLNTVREYGYDFITENPSETITKTRGFKRKADDVMKAEQRLIFTTMRK